MKFFIWLLLQRRIQCRSNLHRRNIVDSPVCEICQCEDETPERIIFRCPFAVSFWARLGIALASGQPIGDLVLSNRPDAIPEMQFPMFLALCCWQLWKRRNRVIFRNKALNMQQVISSCKVEANVWFYRLPVASRALIDQVCSFFDSVM